MYKAHYDFLNIKEIIVRRIKPPKKVEIPYSQLTVTSKPEAQKIWPVLESQEALKIMRDVEFTANDTDMRSRTWSTQAGPISGQSIIEAMARELAQGSINLRTPLVAKEPAPSAKWQDILPTWKSPVPLDQLPDNHIKNPKITQKIKEVTRKLKQFFKPGEATNLIIASVEVSYEDKKKDQLFQKLLDIAFECRESIHEIGQPFFAHVKETQKNCESGWVYVLQNMELELLYSTVEKERKVRSEPYNSPERRIAFEMLALLSPYHDMYISEIDAAISAGEYDVVPVLLRKLEKCPESGLLYSRLERYSTYAEYNFVYGIYKGSLSQKESGEASLDLRRESISLLEKSVAYSDRLISSDVNREYLNHNHMIRLAKSYYNLAIFSKGKPYEDHKTLKKYYNKTIETADKAINIIASLITPLAEANDIALRTQNNLLLLNMKADACMELEKYDAALDCFDAIIAADRENHKSFYGKSTAYYKSGNYNQSLLEAKHALTLIAKNTDRSEISDKKNTLINEEKYKIYMQVGLSFRALKKYKEAMKPFQASLELVEDNTAASYQISMTHKEMGETGLAKRLMGQILPRSSEDDHKDVYEIIMSLAELHYLDSEFHEAIVLYQRAQKIRGLSEYETGRVNYRISYTLNVQKKMSAKKVVDVPPAVPKTTKAPELPKKEPTPKFEPKELRLDQVIVTPSVVENDVLKVTEGIVELKLEMVAPKVVGNDSSGAVYSPGETEGGIGGTKKVKSRKLTNYQKKNAKKLAAQKLRKENKDEQDIDEEDADDSVVEVAEDNSSCNSTSIPASSISNSGSTTPSTQSMAKETPLSSVPGTPVSPELSFDASEVPDIETGDADREKEESGAQGSTVNSRALSSNDEEFIPYSQIRDGLISLAYKFEELKNHQTSSYIPEKEINIKMAKLDEVSRGRLLWEVIYLCQTSTDKALKQLTQNQTHFDQQSYNKFVNDCIPFKQLFPYQYECYISSLKFAANREQWGINTNFEDAVSWMKVTLPTSTESFAVQEGHNPTTITGNADHH